MLAVGGGGAVDVVAGVNHAVDDCQAGGVGGAGTGVLEVLGLAGAQLLEHVVGDGHLAGRIADAGADTAKVATAHLVDDGAQAVVAGMAATHLDAHVAGGDIELVVDHEQFLGLNLVLAAELGDGAARGVHVRLRLDQHNLTLAALFLRVAEEFAQAISAVYHEEPVSTLVGGDFAL